MARYNYTHAARRLMADAVVLWIHGTQETAAHLAGLSAECALKSILVGLGVVEPGADGQLGLLNRPLRTHIDRLWGEFQAQLQGRGGSAYLKLLPVGVPPPFDSWRVEHRYVAQRQLAPHDLERWMWVAIAISRVLEVAADQKEAQ